MKHTPTRPAIQPMHRRQMAQVLRPAPTAVQPPQVAGQPAPNAGATPRFADWAMI